MSIQPNRDERRRQSELRSIARKRALKPKPKLSTEAERQRWVRNSWNWKLREVYRITQAEYDRMLAEQGGVCAICHEADRWRLGVDHCHETGRVRGLLCRRCNRTIGQLRHSVEILRRAAAYLEK